MALRVLLADESVTIKKVIQLALQDFAVEVKAVPVGLDVLEVSKSFQPDLVFADILLQKRSGYDVCRDLKKDPQTAAIPVILMWSSFMELDARQMESCGADGKLEKPFEVEHLRKLVLDLVPRTRSQRLATFLEYPASIAASLKAEVDAAKAARPALQLDPPTENTETYSHIRMPPPLAGTPKVTDGPPTGSLSAHTPGIPDRPPKPAGPPPGLEVTPEASIPTAKTRISGPTFTLNSDHAATPQGAVGSQPGKSAGSFAIPQEASQPLGALPDLQLDGQPPSPSSWNMDSFEPVDLSPLSLDDDDGDAESFEPIRLPTAEPAQGSRSGNSFELGSDGQAAMIDLSLDTDDDEEADKWSNSSLDKYRLPPLKPEESLGVDDMIPDFARAEKHTEKHFDDPPMVPDSAPVLSSSSLDRFNAPLEPNLAATLERTVVLDPLRGSSTNTSSVSSGDEDVAEFTLSEADFDSTSLLEIEQVEQEEKTRPSIVRELLRDPDFSYDDATVRQQTQATSPGRDFGGAVDLSSAGRPPQKQTGNMISETAIRNELEPQLEKVVERIVAELLPKIAERIIKRELERLLEDS